jgi:group II intron reverse transcriptase/maturase
VAKAKPFNIPKREVWEAFKKVKANQGAAGVDGQTIAEFEADLSNNLYRLWNRMSSGSYFPPPVRRVDLPKGDGRTRPLGIPTVGDRVAQEVVKRYLEPILEPIFHDDSYGYRPGRSAIDALQKTRQRCWRFDWVLDIDVQSYFDSIDWELLLKAVRHQIGTTVETAQPQADPDAVSIANRSLPYGPADHATQRSSIGGYGGAEPYCKLDVVSVDMEPSL